MGLLTKGLHSIDGAYVGSSEVKKIYQGDTLVWDSTTPYDAEIEWLGFNYSDKQYIRIDTLPSLPNATQIGNNDVVKLTMEFYAETSQSGRNFIASLGWDQYLHYIEIKNSKIGANGYGRDIAFYNYTNSIIAAEMTVSLNLFNVNILINNTNNTFSYQETSKEIIPITIGCLLGKNASYTGAKIKVVSAAIYVNGTVNYDFIPVRVGFTGYMYDKVSGTLFGNSGTGSFTLGSDIS